MNLTAEQQLRYERDGCVLIENVLDTDELLAADDAIGRLYSGSITDGIIEYPEEPGLFPLYQHPALERIAQHMLAAEDVVIDSAAVLHKRAEPGAKLALQKEHMDSAYTRDEWRARPRRIICVLMVAIADLPQGRGNTYARLGSHMQMAEWLTENKQGPVERRLEFADLPDLPWRDPIPIVAQAGDVVAFTTNLIHAGTPNLDRETRRIMFVNFCMAGLIESPDHLSRRTRWRDMLRAEFPDDRKYLLDHN